MLIRADARTLPLTDGCVQCCVTSPPYFNLRDYGTATWDGGDVTCTHTLSDAALERGFGAASTLVGSTTRQKESARARHRCPCGAQRVDRQIGLEPSPAAYVEALVGACREVWRVLKDDGVLWLNLGDSYSGSGPSGASYQSATTKRRAGMKQDGAFRISPRVHVSGLTYDQKKPIPPAGFKAKDLLGIPWRVAFALQADGWYLRSDIIWSKPNPMPESVTDRPTKAHEYLFLLTKAERYYYDADAIAEALAVAAHSPGQSKIDASRNDHDRNERIWGLNGTRNKRSVWTIPTLPYAGAHFATMPETLVEPCILAGSRLGDLILDPFSGSGTVLAVAERTGRRSVGVDLNPAYHALAKKRTAQRGLRFEHVVNE